MIYGVKKFFSTSIYYNIDDAIKAAYKRIEGITTMNEEQKVKYANKKLLHNFKISMNDTKRA